MSLGTGYDWKALSSGGHDPRQYTKSQIEQLYERQAAEKKQKEGPTFEISLPRLDMPPPIITVGKHKMSIFNFFVVKKELEYEVKRLKSILDIDRKNLQAEFDILAQRKTAELIEHLKLQKIEMEDKLNKQATLYNDSLNKLASVHAAEKSELEARLAKEYYAQMTAALREVNLEGNAQSKYIQELSMKMFDKALEKPMPAHMIEERIVRREEK